jgi:hypothetical protein
MYIYIRSGNDYFYYFGYQKGRLELSSNNQRFEEEFNKIKPKDRIKKMPDGENLEIEWAESVRGEMFVRRVQAMQAKQ